MLCTNIGHYWDKVDPMIRNFLAMKKVLGSSPRVKKEKITLVF